MTSVATSDERARVPGQRTALAIMTVVMVLTMTTWFSASAVIPQLREDWHLSTTEASFLTIAVQAGFVVGALGSALFNLALDPGERTDLSAKFPDKVKAMRALAEKRLSDIKSNRIPLGE